MWEDGHKSTQGWKVSFWGSVRGKYSVNNKMNECVENILQNKFYAYCYILLSGTRSGESRIIFFPERCSICQYRPKLSAINVKKQSRARLLLAHPVLYILKAQKTYGTFWKPPFQNQPKSVLTPHTTAYLLILYLQSTYPKIANLILILYIVCRALGCFKGGSCERFAIDVIQISTTRRAGFNWCEALG